MVTVVPTFSDVRYGPRACNFFDYYQNPTRVTGGNPLLMFRHGGSGVLGSHRVPRDSNDTEYFYFFQWLLAHHAATEPEQHWDVCSFTSAEAKHNSVIPRERAIYWPEAIFECQEAIATILGEHDTYDFNPKKVVGMGHSYGATTMALAQLMAPYCGNGNLANARASNLGSGTWSSRLRGLIFAAGFIDFQNSVPDNPTTGVDYTHYTQLPGLIGISSQAELDAIPAAMRAAFSVKEYFVRRQLAYYPGFLVTFIQDGDGQKPLANAGHPGFGSHDSIQHGELTSAMRTAGVEFGDVFNTSYTASLLNADYGTNGTSAGALSTFRQYARWMSGQIATP